MAPTFKTVSLPYPVPYCSQVASPELANEFFDQGRALDTDPRWAETGARSPEEYAYWADRACGIACAKMAVEAFGGPVLPIMDWIRAGCTANGYVTRPGDGGALVEIGWSHAVLADLIRPYASACWAQAGDVYEIAHQVSEGNLVIASVSYEIGTENLVTRRGGHLVVITGVETYQNWRPSALILHNPSGRSEEMRVHARIPAERFTQGATGRIIIAVPPAKLIPSSWFKTH